MTPVTKKFEREVKTYMKNKKNRIKLSLNEKNHKNHKKESKNKDKI